MHGYADIEQVFQIQTLYTCFEIEIAQDFFFIGERHNFWELVFVLQGEVGVTAGEDIHILHQGQAVLHEPMEFHRLWYTGSAPAKVSIISFGGVYVPNCGKFFTPTDPAYLESLLRKISTTFERNEHDIIGLGNDFLYGQILLKELELFFLKIHAQKPHTVSLEQSASAKNYIRIVRLLENHIHMNLSISDIARMCSMSPVNAKQTFSRYAGIGIKEYFNRLKIKAAVSMLQEGASVRETAELLGFSSQQYFCTVFRRITGRTPSSVKQDGAAQS